MLLQITLAIADDSLRKRIRPLLRQADARVEVIKGKRNLWDRAYSRNGDVVIIDHASLAVALSAGAELTGDYPKAPAVIAVTESESAEEHGELVASGCEAVLQASLSDSGFIEAIEAILDRRRERSQMSLARRPLAAPRFADFVSESAAMLEFMEVAHRVMKSKTSLLILGETGVGKEHLARAIHAEGPRSAGPFVAINCGALPESLMESELFGHEEGAFTGATRSRKGAFELAHDGTIFLDEIGDMPLHLQVKLLRVLQEHEVRRVGADEAFEVNVRVMAASNRDIDAEVEAGHFRRDLYYRLGVVTLEVPPLRERREDIPALAASYLIYHRSKVGREVDRISPEAMSALCIYSWPGNVRELINVIERAMLLCRDQEITLADLPPGVRKYVPARDWFLGIPRRAEEIPSGWLERPLKELRDSMVAELERVYLTALLAETGGQIGQTANRAGMEPRSLYDKMRRYNLAKEDFRPSRHGKRCPARPCPPAASYRPSASSAEAT